MSYQTQLKVGDKIILGDFTTVTVIESYGGRCRLEVESTLPIKTVKANPMADTDKIKNVVRGYYGEKGC